MRSIKIGVVVWIIALVLCSVVLTAAEHQVTLTAPAYRVATEPDGSHQISMAGYAASGIPGYPALPTRVFYVALPPDVDIQSIAVTSEGPNPVDLGTFQIKELPPMATWDGKNRIVDQYSSVYGQDRYFPETTVEYLGYARLRKWRIAKIGYSPFQYNPVTRDLRMVPSVNVRINYSLSAVRLASDAQLVDGVMDARARDMLLNYSTAAAWYKPTTVVPRVQATNDYVIITTNAIESAYAAALTGFTGYLTGKGFTPLIVTEDDFGGLTGQSPNGPAEKIRQWLINNYAALSIKYVLLIGNPNPSTGAIPMKMCWPRHDQASYQESPTDYFYADLTGNWDLDADGYFGEFVGDKGTGGVDFVNEVYVGRIPIYDEYPNLDGVLAKIIAYGNSSDTAWRRNILLPESFSDATTDGAYLGEAIVNNFVAPSGIDSYRQYMQGGFCAAANSTFESEGELLPGSTAAHWSANPYGLVLWWGHGNWFGAYLGYSGCGTATFFDANNVSSMNNAYPAFVYQCSCLNGEPEQPSNLGSLLLIQGAVATVSASRVSWYAVTSWATWLKYYADNASIGYFYAQELVTKGKPAGDALFDVKSDMGANSNDYWPGSSWMNLFDFNLYGDPAIALFSEIVVSGTIRETNNSPIAGVTLSYGSGSATTDANGFYSILVDPGWSGTVTPSKTGYIFSPASRSYSALAVSSFSQDYGRTNTTAGVTTAAISNIATTTATSGGTVLADGGATVTARGVCWGTAQNPTIAGSHTTNGAGTGTFTSSLTSLLPNTLYYVRAYATNTYGTAYGNELSFMTAQITYTLSLVAGGSGGGTVIVGGNPTPHELPYQEVFTVGFQLGIRAVANSGSRFTGWSGDLVSTDNPAVITMNGNMTITANFEIIPSWTLSLTKGGTGGGKVKVGGNPTPHDLPYEEVFLDGFQLGIEVVPDTGSTFTGWSGALVSEDNPAVITMNANMAITANFSSAKDDFVGTWDGQGVYYRNSDTEAWVKLASPATKITVGDMDGDEIDDLIGLWPTQGGIWVKYSGGGTWAKLSSTAQYICTGDMNGDGRVDLVGTWDGQGVFYRNSITGAWVKLATPATMVTAGDIDDDGTDDLVGLWPSQGGIWVKYSQSGAWAKLSSTAVHIAAGDMNGDGRDDLLGTWDGQGVFYRDSVTGAWVKMASPATLITTGDIDGDAIDDLIGIWPTQGGVWVKYSSDGTWERLSSTAQDIAAGKMRAAEGGEMAPSEGVLAAQQEVQELPLPMGGNADGPRTASLKRDLSDRGPGGARFVYLEDVNLDPKEKGSARLNLISGPGEPGAKWAEQTNLFPQETPKKEERKAIRK
jgi:hypothetical protein